MNNKKQPIIAIVLVIVSLLLIGLGSTYQDKLDSNLSSIQAKIDATKESNAGKDDDVTDDASANLDPKSFVAEATEKGKLIADVEKRYSQTTLSMEGKDSVDAEIEQIEGYTEELNQYFADNVSTSDKTNWYSGKDVEYTWEFQPVCEFGNSSLTATWVCKQKDTGDVLAITTAKYDAVEGVFKKVSRMTTAFGYSYIPSTGDDGLNKNAESYADAILKMAEENKVEEQRDMTDDEKSDYSNAKSAQDALKEQMDKGDN